MAAKPALNSEPDLVDRIFEMIEREAPHLTGGMGAAKIAQLKTAARHEFAGETCYIASKSPQERQRELQTVLSFFNGRNPTQTARELGISRATVYRKLKQARLEKAANDPAPSPKAKVSQIS